jgi:hypothetical protein
MLPARAYPRLEPIVELDNVRMLHPLQHLELVVDHLLVAANILLQDDLDSDLALGAVRFPDDTICSSAQCLSEAVSRSAIGTFSMGSRCAGYESTNLRS